MGELHVYENLSALSFAAADWVSEYIARQQATNGRFSLLLSGGNTPKQLYDLLAVDPYSARIDWQKMEIFFGDERFVPFNDVGNNGRMAFDHLLSKVPIPADTIHYIKTDIPESESAREYGKMLRRFFKDVTFDLAMLGLGDDAHTLSLFPGSPALNENYHWVVQSTAPVEPKHRITLTKHPVKLSKCIMFLVSGSSKADAMRHVLESEADIDKYPAQIFRDHENVHWFADRDAIGTINYSGQ